MEYEERESEFDIEDEDKSEPEQTGNLSLQRQTFVWFMERGREYATSHPSCVATA